MTKDQSRNNVPLGPKPKRTAEIRAALAAVTPARIERARDLIRAYAPTGAEDIADARTVKK